MNVGVFSGSFNPIHIGHLILANYITEFTDMDEVWFIVTPHNPLKVHDSLIDENLRLEMAHLALKDYPKLKACDFEFFLSKPSYTANTLKSLTEKYPKHSFTLIIGADNWQIFDKWKDYKYILDNYRIVVYPRLGFTAVIEDTYRNMVETLSSPIVEISSTFIRENIAKGKNMQAFLDDNVSQFIKENELYQS